MQRLEWHTDRKEGMKTAEKGGCEHWVITHKDVYTGVKTPGRGNACSGKGRAQGTGTIVMDAGVDGQSILSLL